MSPRPTPAPFHRLALVALLALAVVGLAGVAPAAAELAVAKVDLTASAAATAAAPQITLYATSWCGYCQKTRELLAELGAAYVEKDIEKSTEGRKEYQAKGKGYRGVPLLDIGGTIVRGYEPEEIRTLVAALGDKAKAPEPPAEGSDK